MKTKLPIGLRKSLMALMSVAVSCSIGTATQYEPSSQPVTITNNDYLWNGTNSTLTQSGAVTWSSGWLHIGGIGDIELTKALSGSGSLYKEGSDTVVLTQQSRHTGGTFVKEGTLVLQSGGSGGAVSGSVYVYNGATLKLNEGDATGYNGDANSITKITLYEGSTLQIANGNNQTFGNMNLTLQGAQITGGATKNFDLFNGQSSITSLASSTTSVIDSKFNLRQDNTNITVQLGTTSDGVDLRALQTIGNGAQGAHNMIKKGAGVFELVAANSYTGNTTINGGAIKLNFNYTGAPSSNIMGTSSGIVMGGGRLEIVGKDNESSSQQLKSVSTTANTHSTMKFEAGVNGNLAVNLGGTTSPSFGDNSLLLLDVGQNVTLTSSQAGWNNSSNAIWLDRTNGFSFVNQTNTSLTAGTVFDTYTGENTNASTNYQILGAANVTGGNAKSLYVLSTSADQTLNVSGSFSIAGSSGGSFVVVNDHNYSISGGILTGGPFVKMGSGELTLSMILGDGNYSQHVDIVDGTLNYTSSKAQSFTGKFSNNGTFIYSGGNVLTISGAAGQSGGNFIVNSGTVYFTSSIANNSAMSGNFTINSGAYLGVGANNQTGGGSAGSLGTGTIFINNGGTFGINLAAEANDTTRNLNNAIVLNAGGTIRNVDGHNKLNGNLTINAEGNAATLVQYWNKHMVINGLVSGSGQLNLNTIDSSDTGALSLTLNNNNNSFTGTYNVNPTNSGPNEIYSLVIKADNAARLASVNLNTSKARLSVNTANAAITGLSGVSGSQVNASNNQNTLTVLGGGHYAGSFSGGFTFVKTGSDSLTLAGDSTGFTGNIYLNSGNLILTHQNSLGAAGKLVVSGTNNTLQDQASAVRELILVNDASVATDFIANTNQSIQLGKETVETAQATIQGNLTMNGGALKFDLGSTIAGNNDLLLVEGNLSLTANSQIIINNYEDVLETGYYLLAQTNGIDLGTYSFNTNLIGGRISYVITKGNGIAGSDNNLYLQVSGSPYSLNWNDGISVWNATDSGVNMWDLAETGVKENFQNGDIVNFGAISGTSSHEVIIEGEVVPSILNITGGGYVFKGNGSIEGDKTKLVVSDGGSLRIENSNNFAGSTLVETGGELTLGSTTALKNSAITGTGAVRIDWGASNNGAIASSAFEGTLSLVTGILNSQISEINNLSQLEFQGGTLNIQQSGQLTQSISGTQDNQAVITIGNNTLSFDKGSKVNNYVTIIGGSVNFGNDTSFAGSLTIDGGVFNLRTNENHDSLGTGELTLINGAKLVADWGSNSGNTWNATSKINFGNNTRYDNVAQGGAMGYHQFSLMTGDDWAYMNGNTNVGNTYQYGSITGAGNLQYGYNANQSHYGMTWRTGWTSNDYVGKTALEATSRVTFEVMNALANNVITPFGEFDATVENSATMQYLGAGIVEFKGNNNLDNSTMKAGFIFENNATLKFDSMGDVAVTGIMDIKNHTVNLNLNNSHVTLNGAMKDTSLSGTGTLNVSTTGNGSLIIAGGAQNFAGTYQIGNGASLVFNTNATVLNKITGAGSFVMSGGIVTLNNSANDYQGGTLVKSGTLILGAENALGNSAVTITDQGTLDINHQAFSNDIIFNGGHLDNYGLYSGSLTVNSDGLSLNKDFHADLVISNGISVIMSTEVPNSSSYTLNDTPLFNLNSINFGEDSRILFDLSNLSSLTEGNYLLLSTTDTTSIDITRFEVQGLPSSQFTGNLLLNNNNQVVLSVTQNQIPEPSTMTLSILGLAGLLLRRRRKVM